MKPRAAVVVFPGSNCDRDVLHVLNISGFNAVLHWHNDPDIEKYSFIVLPGGFTYGDYLRPGGIAHISPVMESLINYIEHDQGLVMGICNGFQILTETGIIEGALLRNESTRFICRNEKILITDNRTPFTGMFAAGEEVMLPIAHSSGRYFIEENQFESIEDRAIIRYVNNPNGSSHDIAGMINKRHNVLGLMPHPERNSESILWDGNGLKFFQSIFKHVRGA